MAGTVVDGLIENVRLQGALSAKVFAPPTTTLPVLVRLVDSEEKLIILFPQKINNNNKNSIKMKITDILYGNFRSGDILIDNSL